MKKTLILLAALAVSVSASALDIQDYVLGGARPRGIGAVTPAMDGRTLALTPSWATACTASDSGAVVSTTVSSAVEVPIGLTVF